MSDNFMISDNNFIVTPRDGESVQLSIRIQKRIRDGFDDLARKTGRTRNELIHMALDYSLKNVKLID
ncbi:MAG: CopG family transcriptional regulator [Oscillospiraceae bacterium]|nr:CopG family transcriptional regulator [Oscillospiraceae bacterium]